ncbi:hypothetical protein BK026_11205 [Alteromonas sp. V450]|uniref:aKG-HExxH-type peptide beta-hydroxylase n=1 Tax=Alteromonas sp. V450 TaxID=1912139 RepID=UPI0008FF1C6F|nr:HEXXH motif-containing putative peptide modification protein [Alteromonas sp. V450]OJF69308.1 hypothetical protein BK026_11205 [Alteromonas sp. V450]
MDCSFLPCSQRGDSLDRIMRGNLATSLQYIYTQTSNEMGEHEKSIQTLIEALKSGQKFSALTFALYTYLVFALTGQSEEKTEDLFALLGRQRPIALDMPQIVTLEAPCFMGEGERLSSLMNIEDGTAFLIKTPDVETSVHFEQRLKDVLLTMEKVMPELSNEFYSLVSQIILVESVEGTDVEFEGGSSYMMWGGLFISVKSYETQAQIIEVLAHESAHMLLFGYASEGRLTLNDEQAAYSSPLRPDPRPMEGIYHATFVTARMFLAMQLLLAYPKLDQASRRYANQACKDNIEAYKHGYQIIKEQGELSTIGAEVMKRCHDYMKPFLEN